MDKNIKKDFNMHSAMHNLTSPKVIFSINNPRLDDMFNMQFGPVDYEEKDEVLYYTLTPNEFDRFLDFTMSHGFDPNHDINQVDDIEEMSTSSGAGAYNPSLHAPKKKINPFREHSEFFESVLSGYKELTGFKPGHTPDRGGFQYKELWEQEITTVRDHPATLSSDSSKSITIPKGSKVKVLIKRMEKAPEVMQLDYNGTKVNVNAGPFINQYLSESLNEEKVGEFDYEPTMKVIEYVADMLGLDMENVKQANIKMYNDFNFSITEIPNQAINWFDVSLSNDESNFIVDVPNSAQKIIPVEKIEIGLMNEDPCWAGYEQIGMKDKDGKQVPNCIPISEEESSEFESGDKVRVMPASGWIRPGANITGIIHDYEGNGRYSVIIDAPSNPIKIIASKHLHHINNVNEEQLDEANIPDNIKKFAQRKYVLPLVKKIASWAEKAGKRIKGGTAIGKDYNTLILDLTYQGGEIRINCETHEIEVNGEEVYDYSEFINALGQLNENYAHFRNETKTRSGSEQYHQAVKAVKRKVQEIAKLHTYLERMQQELSETQTGLKKKKYTEVAIAKIKEEVRQLNKKLRKLK